VPAAPLDAAAFAGLIEALGPWPAAPAVAVALSGGRDSLALAVLLQEWLAPRRGRLLALTVDHRLRPGSAAEAAAVATACARLGIEHRTLAWEHEPLPPGAPVQSAARLARYRLLQQACRSEGLAVLLTAHQADDQRETLLLRLAAGSGLAGLAGMTARRPLDAAVLLRPLLPVARARLAATLGRRGLAWLDDPSNEDPRHRRVAVRQAAPRLAEAGLTQARLSQAVALFGRLRACQERAAALVLAQSLAWHPAAFARLAPSLYGAPVPLARLALGELVRSLGGGAEGPGEAALDRALLRLAGTGRGFTLGGLRFLRRAEGWLALPEARRLPVLELPPGQRLRWGPFQVEIDPAAPKGLRLQPLGQAGWAALAAELGPAPLPGPVLWVQPAVHDGAGLAALPTLGWHRLQGANPLRLRFIPEAPSGAFGFTVACSERHII